MNLRDISSSARIAIWCVAALTVIALLAYTRLGTLAYWLVLGAGSP